MNRPQGKTFTRVGRQIMISPVRVIDSEGNQIGVIPTYDAIRKAEEMGMDLVEIVPNTRPPVCQIMDYGRYKYERSIKEKEQRKKSKQLEMKEVQLRPVTSEHDLEVKVNTAKRFLEEGRAVQVNVLFKKREMMFRDQGMAIVKRMVELLKEHGSAEKAPVFTGKCLNVRLRPIKQS